MKEQLLTSFDETFETPELVEWCGYGEQKDWRSCVQCVIRDRPIDYKEAKSFLSHAIDTAYAEGEKDTKKAFGGCLSCYGKGYSTTLRTAHASADFPGDKSYDYPLFPYIPCPKCERGKQISQLISDTRQKALADVREGVPVEDKAKWGSENQDTYVAYEHGFNSCRTNILSLIDHLANTKV